MPHVTVDGARIYYEDQGRGPVVVFVHGWGASSRFWRLTLPSMVPSYRCIALDMMGFGDSDKPHRDYSIPSLAEFLSRFLDAMDLPSAILVGHSLGGAVCTVTALKSPDKVRALALVNTPLQGKTALFFLSRFLLLPGIRWVAFVLSRQTQMRNILARNFSYAARLAFDLVEDLTKGTYRSGIEPLLSLQRTDLSRDLAKLACPVLSLSTDRDTIVKSGQFDLQRDRIPGVSSVCLAGVGHLPMIESPDVFGRHLKAWLEEVQKNLIS